MPGEIWAKYEALRNKAARVASSSADVARIMVNMGTCSIAAGASEVLAAIEDKLESSGIQAQVAQTGCIGACFAEPLVNIAKPGSPRICYGPLTPEIAPQLIEDYLANDNPRPDLALAVIGDEPYAGIPPWREIPFFKGQERVVLANCGLIDPTSIEEYIARDGYRALAKALAEMTPSEVIAEIKASGLRGRGGAGFPAGLKWEFTAQATGDVKYIICNADESEPGTFKDRLIMEGDPNRVIEGIAIAGYAVGAGKGYIYIRGEYPLAAERLGQAIDQARERGLLGENILGSGFSFDIHIHRSAGAYICGEETALIESLEGHRAEPRVRPPFPPSYGLWGKPTVVNNVETLANVVPIIVNGTEWYKGLGTEKSPGTKVYMLLGDINRPGAVEVPLGVTVRQAIEAYGGGIREDKEFKLAQTGGSAGAIIPASLLDEPLDYEARQRSGLTLGSGSLLIGNEDTDVVGLLKAVMDFFVVESCGKCTPCREGTLRADEILARLAKGAGNEEDLSLLEELAEVLQLGSFCALGQFAALPIMSALKYFRADLEARIGPGKAPPSGVLYRPLKARGYPAESTQAEAQVREIIAKHPAQAEALVDLPRQVDMANGYISTQAMDEIARASALPQSLVYSIATFYSQLSVVPRGRHVIRYCRSAPCHVRGAKGVLDTLSESLGIGPGQMTEDGKFSLEAVSCLGLCGVAPVIMIDDRVYGNLTPEKISPLLAVYR